MKKVFIGVVVLLVCLFLNITYVNAVTLSTLDVSSVSYKQGDKVDSSKDVKEVTAGSSLQLYAMITYGNDMATPETEVGIYVSKAKATGVTWTSSDSSIATVDSTGKVKGIKEGSVTITATSIDTDIQDQTGNTATYEITVKAAKKPNPDTGAFTSYIIIAGGITLAAVLFLVTKNRTKIQKI